MVAVADETKCTSCGAAVRGLVCSFCGREVRALVTPEDERLALIELHQAARDVKDKDALARLFKGAWIPTSPAMLVEAGLQCLPLIEDGQVTDRPVVQRLEAIATRLRIAQLPSEEAHRALAEFQARIQRYERADRNLGIIIVAVLLVICAAAGFGLWSCAHH
jgi:hypothetical protein